jgi:hypothetical protein
MTALFKLAMSDHINNKPFTCLNDKVGHSPDNVDVWNGGVDGSFELSHKGRKGSGQWNDLRQ